MKQKMIWLAYAALGLAGLLAGLNYFTSPEASPEWKYTLKWLNLILVPCAGIGCFIPAIFVLRTLASGRYGRLLEAASACLCCVFLACPLLFQDSHYLDWKWQYFLSACWAGTFLLAGVFLFLQTRRANEMAALCLCLAGSLCLGVAAMEAALLFSSQPADGIENLSASSRYRAGGAKQASLAPGQKALQLPPNAEAHREARFGQDLFDVKYTHDENGWRILPERHAGAANDLLLFGCSFTFGYGLEDTQSWPWQLAELLGPNWDLENYSANGFSANQMLNLLEHGQIQPLTGQNRYALFLAIRDHLRRNEFFPNAPHYRLNAAGAAEEGGKGRFVWAHRLPELFNGSQLAREASSFIAQLAIKNEAPQKLYLAMIEKSAKILRGNYDATLIVLLWPDIEDLAPQLQERGIKVLLARSLLPDWDTPPDPGWKYRIERRYEGHPNLKAATELAEGLARYFRQLPDRLQSYLSIHLPCSYARLK